MQTRFEKKMPRKRKDRNLPIFIQKVRELFSSTKAVGNRKWNKGTIYLHNRASLSLSLSLSLACSLALSLSLKYVYIYVSLTIYLHNGASFSLSLSLKYIYIYIREREGKERGGRERERERERGNFKINISFYCSWKICLFLFSVFWDDILVSYNSACFVSFAPPPLFCPF